MSGGTFFNIFHYGNTRDKAAINYGYGAKSLQP
jgi:hypothetical protein